MAAYLTTIHCEGFKKCCIPNAVNGTDDDMLWNDTEEDGNVKSESEEDEDTDRRWRQ
jgi:hypothetical protein